MTKTNTVQAETSHIPVIDLGPLRDGSAPKEVAEAIHRASRDVGFIYVSNHGIPEDLIERTRDTAMRFFHSDSAQKTALGISDKHRGFLQVGGAKMQDDAQPDLKESFIWGFENADGSAADDHPLRGPNRWPDEMPELRETAMAYFEAAHDVAQNLMRAFALGLDMPEDFFLKGHDRPMSRASMIYYPPQDTQKDSGRFGVGPHTDFGVLTVLCQDDVGGLEVEDLQGNWVAAPPIPGTLIVNVGDLLARWTNDAYRSTPHRVINTSGKERLSLVLAYDPDHPTLIDPGAVSDASSDKGYEPITCGDYLIWRFGRAFGYRKKD